MKKTVKLFVLIMTSTLLFSCGGGGSSEHVHNFSSEWTYDETSHWHVCSGCNERGNLANHTFRE